MKRRAKKDFDYAGTFDRLMGERFGEVFVTQWSIFAGAWGGYITKRANGKNLTKQHQLYGQGLSNGIAAAK